MALPQPDDLSPRSREARDRALDALSRMRRAGLSATTAARAAGTTLETMRRYVGTALRTQPNGRVEASAWDRIVRHMRVITEGEVIKLPVKDSRSASLLGSHESAVGRFLLTGDTSVLAPFRGKSIVVSGERRRLETDAKVLIRLGRGGELSFPDIYALST